MKKISITTFVLPFIFAIQLTQAQVIFNTYEKKKLDSTQILPEVSFVGKNSKREVQKLPELVGTDIFAGKKNALVMMNNVQGNYVSNQMRQVLAKVPGIHIWESDGSGAQIGIATRGLSPNRSSEFNIRQNGNEIAADPISYSEAYYNPQLQGVQKIQIVKGAGALQYGSQFGGMVNYIMKDGNEINKTFEFETQQTMGSYGLLNTFNAIGGKSGKVHYYAFVDIRKGNGWRDNAQFNIVNYFASLSYQVSQHLKTSIEYTNSDISNQQAGGLTDNTFVKNPQQSNRSRNWFNTQWNIWALNLQWNWSKNSQMTVRNYILKGTRNSIGYQISDMTLLDTVNAKTLAYNSRDIETQKYLNFGTEWRNRTIYYVTNRFKNIVSSGFKYYQGDSPYQTSNKGSSGTDANFLPTDGTYVKDYDRKTQNVALFAENAFYVNDKLVLIPGIRYEYIKTEVSSRQSTNAIINTTPTRKFVLLGVSAEYKLPFGTEIYANYTEAYKPFWYGQISQLPNAYKIDENLKDANGYTSDIGYRGSVEDYLFFDIGAFYMKYKNRLGNLTLQDKTIMVTNVGGSTHVGIESFAEINPVKMFFKANPIVHFNVFANYSFTDATYDGFISNGKDIKGNRVQDAPRNIFRTGVNFYLKQMILTYQYSFVDETFSDADNTVLPNSKGTIGLIPAYKISDITFSYSFMKNYFFKMGINNLTNTNYFTRRAGGLPGSGILPGDGRTFYATVTAKF